MSRKKEVVKRMLRQALTEEAMSKMEKKRQLTHVASDEDGQHIIRNHREIDEIANDSDQVMPERVEDEVSGTSTEYHDTSEQVTSRRER
jgi:hypothetical protein